MKHFLFDMDDTLYKHPKDKRKMYHINKSEKLIQLLNNCKYNKYIYTNATYSHANLILNKLGVDDSFEKIYSRDNIPEMKPSNKSALDIEKDISKKYNNNEFYFFDDLLENLKMGKNRNWITIWIHPLYQYNENYEYVDYSFPDIYSAVQYFNTNNI
jgi:FMN phosphatase YigB (HAD superfamily)